MNNPATDRLGIAKLQKVFGSIGWFFREQFIEDYGIDAQVEVVENNRPTGELIALQVKSGDSYCAEVRKGCIIYRPDKIHVEYWVKHSLPVVVVIYSPTEDKAYWCPVAEGFVTKTRKAYRMEIPKDACLDEETAPLLKKVFKLDVQRYRFNRLLLDLSWMKLVREGYTVSVEFEDWVNKSLARTPITISCETDKGRIELSIPTHYSPGFGTFGIIERMLPWADMKMDIETYRAWKEAEYESECFAEYDKETGRTYYCTTFDEWYEEPDGIVPIESTGEIDRYSVILELNDLGEAFLCLAEYLYDESDFEMRSFSIDDS